MPTQPPNTHYATLGIPPTATDAQIRKAYRALAKAHHPDVSADAGATARFAAIAEAFSVLSDPAKRRAYDRSLLEQESARRPVDTRAHYTWTNIAAHDSDKVRELNRLEEIDELYDTFFAPPKPTPPVGEQTAQGQRKAKNDASPPRKRRSAG